MKIIRAILTGIIVSAIISYALIFHFPELNKKLRENTTLHAGLNLNRISPYGMDTSLSAMTYFIWDQVCLIKSSSKKELLDITEPYRKEYQQKGKLNYKQWTFLFISEREKSYRWLKPCKGVKCLSIYKGQSNNSCYSNSNKPVLRQVFIMENEKNAKAVNYILTAQNNNMPNNRVNRGRTQNFLKIYDE